MWKVERRELWTAQNQHGGYFTKLLPSRCILLAHAGPLAGRKASPYRCLHVQRPSWTSGFGCQLRRPRSDGVPLLALLWCPRVWGDGLAWFAIVPRRRLLLHILRTSAYPNASFERGECFELAPPGLACLRGRIREGLARRSYHVRAASISPTTMAADVGAPQ
jgi:hypothetical protein